MAIAKFVEKQIRTRPSMQQDQLGYTPGPEESGIASSFLTFVSMVLIVITFPFSLFFCMRMIQVSGRKLHTDMSKKSRRIGCVTRGTDVNFREMTI